MDDGKKIDLTNKLSLVPDNDPGLREMLPIYHGDPGKLRELAFDMFKMMVAMNGVGLSANQVGRKERFFVMYGPKSRGFRDAIVAINPEVITQDEETEEMIEGCLTWPSRYSVVKRPKSIKVQFTNLKGERIQALMNKMFARIFLHELDHLRGLTMFDAGQELKLEDLAKAQPETA